MEIAFGEGHQKSSMIREGGEAGHKIRFVSEVWIGTRGCGDVGKWPVKCISHLTSFEEHPTLQKWCTTEDSGML